MNTWVIADTHFGHVNLQRGTTKWKGEERLRDCRDFNTVEEHDALLLENINKNVKKDDILYHVGDFSMGGKDNVWKYRYQINCKTIHLIKGNHDIAINKNQVLNTSTGFVNARNLFTSVNDILEKKIGGEKMVFCHFPILRYHRMGRYAIHMYGHTHEELNYWPSAVCVSVDCHPEFRPFHIEEVRDIVKNRLNGK
jgi:calcineurin-like phosphoesterase family protein